MPTLIACFAVKSKKKKRGKEEEEEEEEKEKEEEALGGRGGKGQKRAARDTHQEVPFWSPFLPSGYLRNLVVRRGPPRNGIPTWYMGLCVLPPPSSSFFPPPLPSLCIQTCCDISSTALSEEEEEKETAWCSRVGMIWCAHIASCSFSPCVLQFCLLRTKEERKTEGRE